jgi:hypothetical protein
MDPTKTATQSKKHAANMVLTRELPFGLRLDRNAEQLPPPNKNEKSKVNNIGL